uniref:Uncharacterized protein n=1 Tax=viral metagenome TaxID=1070528 RepID=A0A6C0LFF2_9ZZZZ
MDYLYVFIRNGGEWEDMVVFLSKEKAIDYSKKYADSRVEMFMKDEHGCYVPSYQYYKNGKLFETE